MTRINFWSNGYRIAGNFFEPDIYSKKQAFLFIQGWTGHQNIEAAHALVGLGYSAMTYDMRGNGQSEGDITKFSRADFLDDAIVAYDFLNQKLKKDSLIGVVGSSFGSYTAVLLTAKRKVYCLSLRVPASYPDEEYNSPLAAQAKDIQLSGWRNKKLSHNENHAFATLHDFKGSVQIIEAGADKSVPSQSPKNYSNSVADKTKLTYEIVPDAPHRLEDEQLKADYTRRLVDWVRYINNN